MTEHIICEGHELGKYSEQVILKKTIIDNQLEVEFCLAYKERWEIDEEFTKHYDVFEEDCKRYKQKHKNSRLVKPPAVNKFKPFLWPYLEAIHKDEIKFANCVALGEAPGETLKWFAIRNNKHLKFYVSTYIENFPGLNAKQVEAWKKLIESNNAARGTGSKLMVDINNEERVGFEPKVNCCGNLLRKECCDYSFDRVAEDYKPEDIPRIIGWCDAGAISPDPRSITDLILCKNVLISAMEHKVLIFLCKIQYFLGKSPSEILGFIEEMMAEATRMGYLFSIARDDNNFWLNKEVIAVVKRKEEFDSNFPDPMYFHPLMELTRICRSDVSHFKLIMSYKQFWSQQENPIVDEHAQLQAEQFIASF